MKWSGEKEVEARQSLYIKIRKSFLSATFVQIFLDTFCCVTSTAAQNLRGGHQLSAAALGTSYCACRFRVGVS